MEDGGRYGGRHGRRYGGRKTDDVFLIPNLTLWVPGGHFRPWVIKVLAISKRMIQLP